MTFLNFFLCSWQAVTSYVDQQYEAYLQDESGLNRRHIVDNRVHCCLYFICPHGHGLVVSICKLVAINLTCVIFQLRQQKYTLNAKGFFLKPTFLFYFIPLSLRVKLEFLYIKVGLLLFNTDFCVYCVLSFSQVKAYRHCIHENAAHQS